MRKRMFKMCAGLALAVAGLFLCGNNCLAFKFPNFQVWGGSVFTYGDIKVSEGTPRTSGNKQFMFSSWVEYGVFANGYVTGLASGAASSGGSQEDGSGDFCRYRTPLSFANYSTNDSNICSASSTSGKTGVFGYNYPKFNMKTSLTEVAKETTVSDGDIILTAESITGRKVVATNKNVEIVGDLVYNTDDKVYYSLEEVPKLLIYANNINIHCNVGRVDAILFASGMVNTCSDGPRNGNSPDYEQQAYSKQLVINGAIIAKEVNFQRTYGAVDLGKTTRKVDMSRCEGSNVLNCAAIPAEIVNYDVSILVTGKNANTASAKANLVTVYQRELAPRY